MILFSEGDRTNQHNILLILENDKIETFHLQAIC